MLLKLLRGRFGGSPADPLETAFGVLERDVMDVLWAQADLAVRDVQAQLPRRVAYTTVMTTLDRLFKKGVLTRRKAGRAFLYAPAVTREQLQASIAGHVLNGLLAGRDTAAVPVLSNLVDSMGAQQGGEELLERLEKLVREKRRRLRRQG